MFGVRQDRERSRLAHRLLGQVDDCLDIGTDDRLYHQHRIDEFDELVRVSSRMPIPTTGHSHRYRLTIRLEWGLSIRTCIQCAAERLSISPSHFGPTHPDIDFLIQRLARLDVKEFRGPVRHRRVLASDILLQQSLLPCLDLYTGSIISGPYA